MSLWGILSIVAGTLIGIGILAKVTGLGDIFGVIIDIIGHFFAAARDFFTTLTIAAPGPVKIVIFIVIFVTLSSVMINYTVGINYVCSSNGDLYRGSIPSAITYQSLIGINEADIKVHDVKLSEEIGAEGFTKTDVQNELSGGVVGATSEKFVLIPLLVDYKEIYGYVSPDRYVESLIDQMLSNAKKSAYGGGAAPSFKTDVANVFGSDTYVTFHICYDPVYKTCVLDSDIGEAGVCTGRMRDAFIVRYWYDLTGEEEKIVSKFYKRPLQTISSFLGYIPDDMSGCEQHDEVFDDAEFYIPYSPSPVKITQTGFGDGYIYNARWYSVSYVEVNETRLIGNKISYYSGGYSSEQMEDNILYGAEALLESSDFNKVNESMGVLITKKCVSDGQGGYDKEIGIYGIPIFNKEYMFAIVFMVIALGIIGFIKGR
jgi:hypothetical protein